MNFVLKYYLLKSQKMINIQSLLLIPTGNVILTLRELLSSRYRLHNSFVGFHIY
jgi:hypothetical protein